MRPQQNWIREEAKILGSVFLYVDYNVPIEPLRAELRRVIESHPLWDGDVCGLQVTDCREHLIEIRCEALVTFLRDHHPEALPRMRAELTPLPAMSA